MRLSKKKMKKETFLRHLWLAQCLMFILMWRTVNCEVSSSAAHEQLETHLNYSVIEATGKACPGRDTCQSTGRQNRGPESIEKDWKKRNCFCDNECAQFGDCCVDAPAYRQSEQMTSHAQFECLNFKQYGDIYVRSRCPSTWTSGDDDVVKLNCENPNVEGDPFGRMPVTNAETGVTYSNYFCAICNADDGDLKLWNSRLECPTLTGYVNRFRNMTEAYIEKNVHYDEEKRQWGVDFDTGGVPVFHACYIDPALPDTLADRVRPCSGRSTIKTCPDDFRDEDVRRLCSSYTALVFEPNVAYRNVHCAMCNNAQIERLNCVNLGPFGRNNWQQNFNTFSFAVLFDLGGEETDSVGFERSACREGELYDPFFKKCRNVVCGSDKKTFRNGRCINTEEIKLTDLASKATTTTTITTTTTSLSTTTSTALPSTTTTTTPVPQTINPLQFPFRENATSSNFILEDLSTSRDDSFLKEIETNTLMPSNSIEKIHVSTTGELSFNSDDLLSSTTAWPMANHSHTFSECPKFMLHSGEFKVINDSSIFVETYDKYLTSGQYELLDGGNNLVICAQTAGGTDQVGKFGPLMSYVTLACLGVSIFCLLLHLVATFISPDLQNLSGKNLFSLSSALLGSYVTFIAAMFRGHEEESDSDALEDAGEDSGCFAVAVLMYFFFMASFFWMLVIAFDVCRTLRLATTQLRLSAGSQWKKFIVYSLFAWILPLTFAVITVVVDRLKDVVPEDYRPGFGEHELCWFSNKKALLVYFAVPFAGIMGFNIFLFLFSAYIVFESSSTGAKMSSCGPKTNFHLYLRLAVIMGLTWITGLAAGFVNLEPLWYTFIALNTLQGLFIFIAFTCTKKVVASIKSRLSSAWERQQHHHLSVSTSSSRGPLPARLLHRDELWSRWSKDINTTSTSAGSVAGSDKRAPVLAAFDEIEKCSNTLSPKDVPDEDSSVPSRYGSRSKTMYTVSKYQANCSSYQKSFDGRYF